MLGFGFAHFQHLLMHFPPGIDDTNPAREIVAKHYMSKCDYIWITAHISRAVNNKSAWGTISPPVSKYAASKLIAFQDLVPKNLKDQLVMDGL